MARLPVPGSDNGTWGVILNDFLNVSFDDEGYLKDEFVTSAMLSSAVQATLTNQRVPTANSVDNTKVADGALSQAKVNGLTTALSTKLESTAVITDPTNQNWANVTINDDGSSTSNWIDRFRVTFVPQSGTSRPTFWLNEYGEFRGTPAKDNTVAGRFFAALNAAGYSARSGTVPVLEVTDIRDGTRTTIFGVYKGGRVTMNRLEANETRTGAATTPWITENIDYVLTSGDSDHLRILVQGVTKFWMNEWGAIRGTSPFNWGDALVRAIRETGDGISDGTGVAGSGRALEVVDRRIVSPPDVATAEHTTPSSVMWGVRWKDGRMVQGGALVGAVYTLDSSEDETDIPASLPAGTLIVRKAP